VPSGNYSASGFPILSRMQAGTLPFGHKAEDLLCVEGTPNLIRLKEGKMCISKVDAPYMLMTIGSQTR
jgi:hypothetical protein